MFKVGRWGGENLGWWVRRGEEVIEISVGGCGSQRRRWGPERGPKEIWGVEQGDWRVGVGAVGGAGVGPAPNSRLSAALPCQLHPSPLKRSLSLVPGSPQGGSGEWPGGGEEPGPPRTPFGDHAPLSPQSSVASSGSEQTEEPTGGRNTFQEDGSGMKG